MIEYQIVRLESQHDRTGFDCGNELLNRYLRERAGQDLRANVAVCYVLCVVDAPEILGYYTLSATTIELATLPDELQRRMPRYPLVPAALIGRLAVDRAAQGQHFGERLLLDGLRRTLLLRETLGIAAVTVAAKDSRAAQFYARYGFIPLTTARDRLFLPLATVAQVLGK